MSLPQALSTVICLVALVWPGLSAASYLIQLRNGRHVATSQYWKEGHTIMFYTAGGVGGVPESAVFRIQTVEDPAESGLTDTVEQKTTPQAERQVAPQTEQKATPGINIEEYKKKKEVTKAQIEDVLEKFREASGNKDEQEILRQKISGLSKQIYAINDDVKKQNNGRLPEGWTQE